MADGDIVTIRLPITFDKDTDDGTTKVIESAAALPDANYKIVNSHIIESRKTKEGLTEATLIITAIGKT